MYPDITASALLDVWKEIELKPAEKFKIELKDNAPIFNKDLDVHRFFLFIKMLPCHRIKFESAVKSFMVFSEVCLLYLKCFKLIICENESLISRIQMQIQQLFGIKKMFHRILCSLLMKKKKSFISVLAIV